MAPHGALQGLLELVSLDQRGLLSSEVTDATGAVSDALLAFDLELADEYRRSQAIEALTDCGIRSDARWQMVRDLAGKALSAFSALGVTVPGLLDARYNTGRRSALGLDIPGATCSPPNRRSSHQL